jgi:3'-phosphoadenosine 5'-phosphosulfate sulfotransferase (PAPS reductase)/FAD synthetase
MVELLHLLRAFGFRIGSGGTSNRSGTGSGEVGNNGKLYGCTSTLGSTVDECRWYISGRLSHAEGKSRSTNILRRERIKIMTMIQEKLEQSREIVDKVMRKYEPYAIVAMVSGGKDSLCAYMVARELGVPVTHIMHGVTGTGVLQTTQFVRDFAAAEDVIYLEADAGMAYEDYVRRKGFFGVGVQAHGFSYRILKHQPFFRTISGMIRQKRWYRNVMLLNGARIAESVNRAKNMTVPHRDDGGNIWTNIIHHWTRRERDWFLEDRGAVVNPVTTKLCRSGECLCGTMQNQAIREEVGYYFPEWGNWIDSLEREVKEKFGWGWGELNPIAAQRKIEREQERRVGRRGYHRRVDGDGDGDEERQPMCVDCLVEVEDGREDGGVGGLVDNDVSLRYSELLSTFNRTVVESENKSRKRR